MLDSAFSVGMLFAFMAYKEQFSARVAGLIDKLIELKMLQLQGERLADIVLTPPEEEAPSPAPAVEEASIEVRNLSFRYSDTEPFVLQDCSFRIEPGESVAIVGPSGGGKTTLVKIMLGLLAPTDGQVLVGGVDLQKLGVEAYRRLVGTVMQDDPLLRRVHRRQRELLRREPQPGGRSSAARGSPPCTTTSPPCPWATTR